MLLEQLEVSFEVEEAHVHHVDQVSSVVWVELFFFHVLQVKDLLLGNDINFREFDILSLWLI